MAENENGQERTEEPSQKRVREARERGQVARSRELAAAATLGATALTLLLLGGLLAQRSAVVFRDALRLDITQLESPERLPVALGHALWNGLLVVVPVLVAAMCAALASSVALGGWNFSPQAMMPDFSKLDPVKGLQRLFSLQGLAELGKALLKFVLVGLFAVLALKAWSPSLLNLSLESGTDGIRHAGALITQMLVVLAGALAVIAAIDVPHQWFRHHQSLRMTRQELLDELKESDGRPEVKGRIRRLQAEMSRRRMMEAVPKADVIVTNPTHYAVALKYASGTMRAPRVVAKGADHVAAVIRELAKKHNVPLIEAPPLARALYRSVDIGGEIPVNLYQAVAQVLTYVYQLRNWHRMGGRMPELRNVEVDE